MFHSFLLIISIHFGIFSLVSIRGVAFKDDKIYQNSTAQKINTDTIDQNVELVDVLFATNEDCDLFINGSFKGTITKKAHKYVKLAPGSYTYKAKTKALTDELEKSFTVNENKLNEFFIDILYFLDERKALRESLKGKQSASSTVSKSSVAVPTTTSIPIAEAKSQESDKQILEAMASEMVTISGGSFIMGNNKAPAVDETEHTVTISTVKFNKYEVTQKQWETVMGYNPSINKGCDNCPVENVSWEEVMKFIKKLNVTGGKKFRLPTEAEWEYVAKLGGKEEVDNAGGIENYIKNTAWYYGNADKKTHPVGMKQPTSTGIYDLLGNVSEWCADWYSGTFFKDDTNHKDPDGPPLGKEKVIRGGNFEDYTGDRFRPSLRGKLKPTSKSKLLGFRLVMDL